MVNRVRNRALAVAAAALMGGAALQASAAVVDFNGVFDSFGPGQARSTYDDPSGFRFSAAGGDALIDFSFCEFPDFCATTTGNSTEHLQAYNDAVITLVSISGTPFSLLAFDASFLPLSNVNFSGAAIGLRVTGTLADGGTVSTTVDLVEDFTFGGGDWAFSSYTLGSDFSGLSAVSFEACFFTGNTCDRSIFLNDAQFSLDNINAQIPEPHTAMLGALGLLAAFGASSRRRAR